MFDVLEDNPALGRAEALRQSMMKMASSKEQSHPIYWGPFVVVGEGGTSPLYPQLQ